MTLAAVRNPAGPASPAGAADATKGDWLTLRVVGSLTVGEVRSLRLVDPEGGTLPSFVPGSHVIVEAGARRNAYSLTGEFLHPDAYTLSILRLADGRGGSRWLHDELGTGGLLRVSRPRSTFAPAARARHHVLIAGGIGVTPILSHVRAARRYGRSFEVLYAHRRDAPAHMAELRELCGPDRLRTAIDPDAVLAIARERLADQPLGTAVSLCGPGPMMDAILAIAAELGWPAQRVHTERFATEALDPGTPFTVRLARSDLTVTVPSGVSLLEALEARQVPVPNMCRQGVCGECRVGVLAGRPEHRDLYLAEDERAANDSVMCCVSRARDAILELDL